MEKNRFIYESIAYIAASFIAKGISFLTTPIFTRLLDTDDFGAVNNFITWAQFFAIFVFGQASSGLLPAQMNQAKGRFREYVKSIVIFCVISSFIQMTFLIIFRQYVSKWINVNEEWFFFLAICVVGIAFTNVCSSYFIADRQPKAQIIFSLATVVFYAGISLAFVFLSEDKAFGRVIGLTAGYVLVILFSLFYFLRFPVSGMEEARRDIKYSLSFGIPLIPHLLANLVNGNADRIFLIKIWGESEAGIYSVAYSIGMVALTIADACSNAWNPFYFEATKKKDEPGILHFFRLYSVTIVMLFVGVMFLAPEAMKIMAPASYQSGTSCIIYIAAGICFLFLYRFPLAYEQFHSNTRYVAPMTVVSAVVNIGLNTLLIPDYGMKGAAVATTLSYIVLWVTHELVARKTIGKYNIPVKFYYPAICLAVTGFLFSLVLTGQFLLRYIVLVLYCVCYIFYVFSIKKSID